MLHTSPKQQRPLFAVVQRSVRHVDAGHKEGQATTTIDWRTVQFAQCVCLPIRVRWSSPRVRPRRLDCCSLACSLRVTLIPLLMVGACSRPMHVCNPAMRAFFCTSYAPPARTGSSPQRAPRQGLATETLVHRAVTAVWSTCLVRFATSKWTNSIIARCQQLSAIRRGVPESLGPPGMAGVCHAASMLACHGNHARMCGKRPCLCRDAATVLRACAMPACMRHAHCVWRAL